MGKQQTETKAGQPSTPGKPGKVDPFKKGGGSQAGATRERPKVDGFGRISREGYLGQRDDETEDAGSSKYHVIEIAIEKVLDSPFQSREDPSRWNEKQRQQFNQLRLSIREEGLKHVFFVAPA